ncbi:transposase, partial [Planococcus sp. CP5-4]|uniref:transposase n=1 Tax=Planococcus sp. CP5-4 TaxID=2849036 RepID=UPI001CA4D69B
VILYAYSKKIYSSRGIEETLTEHIPSMWLAAGQQPDHRTINRFRSDHLKAMMDSLFEQMIHQLIEQNYITMEHHFWMERASSTAFVVREKQLIIGLAFLGSGTPVPSSRASGNVACSVL